MSTVPDAEPVKEEGTKVTEPSIPVAEPSIPVAEPSIPVAIAADSSKTVAAPPADQLKLSAVELKKQKQAEKAARRAKAIEKKGETGGAGPTVRQGKENRPTTSVTAEKIQGKPAQQSSIDDKVQSSTNGKHKQVAAQQQQPSNSFKFLFGPKENSRNLWSHMPTGKQPGPSFGSKEDMKAIHRDVRTLGLHMITYDVCGSNARLVAMLTVLKAVIKEYKTPENQALTRHIIPQVLSPQITHLAACRPLSVSQGNAIRWLKLRIAKIDVNTPEDEAKEFLCTSIDEFIRDKSTLAHKVIAEEGAKKINDGDVVLTHGYSVVVEKTIRKAWADGKRFELLVIDTEPWREGLKLVESLRKNDDLKEMNIGFGMYNAVSLYAAKATKVFLGAHAMMSNGCLYSRVGAGGVAMSAHFEHVPVVVLCESVKFSNKAPLTTFDYNELAPQSEFMPKSTDSEGKDEPEVYAKMREGADETEGHRILKSFEDIKGLRWSSIMFDLTPAKYINMVISEHGNVPPTSVPVLHRLHNEADEEQ